MRWSPCNPKAIIASNSSSVFDKSWYARKAKAMNEVGLLQPSFIGSKQRPLIKKRQPQNVRGSKQRPPMKKVATPKCKGFKTKTSDGKEATPKCLKARVTLSVFISNVKQ
jgi:hypothetical protein